MKKVFFVACTFATLTAFSQGKTLAELHMLKPKIGHKAAFEAAWKAHVAKFHNGDDKRSVYEIVSGDYSGFYQIIKGPFAYADMDKENPAREAHDLDFEKNVAPKLEQEMGPYMYAFRDSLSYNSNIQSDKSVVTVTHVKNGMMPEYLREVRRGALVSTKAKVPWGLNSYVRMFSGSDPVIVTVRSLKEGYKELEANYFNLPQNGFRDDYVKAYSQEDWDKRQKVMNDNITSRFVYLSSHRKDLSSKQ